MRERLQVDKVIAATLQGFACYWVLLFGKSHSSLTNTTYPESIIYSAGFLYTLLPWDLNDGCRFLYFSTLIQYASTVLLQRFYWH
jgi:hypothetical protein